MVDAIITGAERAACRAPRFIPLPAAPRPNPVCPLPPIKVAIRDSSSFYWSQIRGGPYTGVLDHRQDGEFSSRDFWRRLADPTLDAAGQHWTRASVPPIRWVQAEDDVNFGWPERQRDGRRLEHSPRHFHADITLGDEVLHLDYLKQISWGPLMGHEEFLVFAKGQFVARGGNWGQPPAGGARNWPLVVQRGDWLLTCWSPTTVAPLGFSADGVSVWVRAPADVAGAGNTKGC
jgi:hypothetical protein